MSSPKQISFKRAVIWALSAHVLLFVMLMLRVSFPSKDTKSLVINPQTAPIQATLINERELKTEIKRLEALEQKKIDEQLAKEAELKRQEELKKLKLAEAKRLEEVKKQAELDKQKKLAQEKLAKEKAAQEKLAQDKAAKVKAAKDKALAEAADKKAKAQAAADAAKAAQAKAQAERLAQEKALAQAQSAAQSAAQQAEALREIERYKAMVRQSVMRYWIVQQGLAKQDATKLFVRVAPTGTVLDVKVLESSGNEALDRSAVAAVYKASPLPVPQDPDLFRSFRELRLILRPDSILSEG